MRTIICTTILATFASITTIMHAAITVGLAR